MICSIIVGATGLTFGLYAGKRRANGKTWREIACELWCGMVSILAVIWRKITFQFKKDDPNIVEAEIVDSSSADESSLEK